MPSSTPGTAGFPVFGAFFDAPMGAMVTGFDGLVIACNPAMGELLGEDPAALLGTVLFDVVHPQDLEGLQATAQRSGHGERG